MQKFIATYSNWFQECIIMIKRKIDREEAKKEGKQKKENSGDKKIGDNKHKDEETEDIGNRK